MSESPHAMLAALEQEGLGLSQVAHLVSELERSVPSNGLTTFGLSGNITIDLLGTYLRKQAVLLGSRAEVRMGAFGDHVGNVKRFVADGVDAIILLDLFDAFLPAFEAQVSEMSADDVRAQAERYRSELALTLQEAQGIKDVFVARVHRMSPPGSGALDQIDRAVAVFDEVITEEAARSRNVHLISSGAISAQLGWADAHDMRSYQRFGAPFTPAFLDEFAAEIYYATRGFGAYFYKALVLDCDGTLWGGILGEDLAAGIKLGPFTNPGSMYWRVQHEFLSLQRRGVLLCLCSKNDAADVDLVLATHPEMVLREEDIVAKRVNWEDKVANLESLVAELNIGLDSMVFLDDSPFECDSVRSRLPMVKTLQVPADLSKYPHLIAYIKRLFAVAVQSIDGASKTEQYKVRSRSIDDRQRYANQDEYLASLGMKVTIRGNDKASSSRIAELTQKSNQFNLTTRRYTVSEIDELMHSDDADVYSIHVADKFGDAGLTGVVITRLAEPDGMLVDTFLMSCRVLGRGVELSFWSALGQHALRAGRRNLVAEYRPTTKNAQVRDFWDRLGLELVAEDTTGRRAYRSDLSTPGLLLPPPHIEVTSAL